VYIDDATGKLLHLRFCEAETTFDYGFVAQRFEMQSAPN
ncbi:hypothetical protein F890_00532, partial [Acinetobacter sp. CIP 64.7]